MSQANVKEALLATIEGLKENPSASNVVFRAKTRWARRVCEARSSCLHRASLQ